MRSRIARAIPDRIEVRGHDLVDLIGNVPLGDVAFLELRGRLPTEAESRVFNAITVTLVEHGLTPSALAARLTYLGAPESLQGAVAAGLLGLGSRYGGTVEGVARILQEGLADPGADLDQAAAAIVAAHRRERRPIPGLGHPTHKGGDPRVARLFEVAEENGLSGRHVDLERRIAAEAARVVGRELPINATGAIGAIASELQIPWRVCRGLAVMARSIGLVAHLQEEIEEPLAGEVWHRAEADSTEPPAKP